VLILFIIIWGMICGWLAQLILGRTGSMRNTNWTEAIVAGLVGSLVGGLLISLILGDGLELRPSGIVGSVLGAVIVLAVWQAIRGKSVRRT
jgi:uncharacterized membrane protein YeaQ/YmgE (transglycosylase-associated protein family)